MSLDIQLVGALLILSGFTLLQLRALHESSYPYLLMNTVGSGMLTYEAIHEALWGFLLLEASWLVVSLYGLARRARTGASAGRAAAPDAGMLH